MREKIVKTGKRFSVAITGGGTSFINNFLEPGGASAVFSSAFVPYHQDALIEFIGFTPEKFCSEEVAIALAKSALKSHPANNFGVGCTATLKKHDGEREGRKNFFHIAIYTPCGVSTLTQELDSHYIRQSQEHILSNLVLLFIAQYLGFYDKLNVKEAKLSPAAMALFEQGRTVLYETTKYKAVVFPGTFNPLHDGHIAIARMANKLTGLLVTPEICVRSVGKPVLSPIEFQRRYLALAERCKEFPFFMNPIVTNMPRFIEKMYGYTNSVFLVGFDTIMRIGDPKHYENWDYPDWLYWMKKNGNRFMVFHRGTTSDDIKKIDERLLNFCTFEQTDEKYQKISSTDIRGV